jgi:hypothetical protein
VTKIEGPDFINARLLMAQAFRESRYLFADEYRLLIIARHMAA